VLSAFDLTDPAKHVHCELVVPPSAVRVGQLAYKKALQYLIDFLV
jgi:hypothetical protein